MGVKEKRNKKAVSRIVLIVLLLFLVVGAAVPICLRVFQNATGQSQISEDKVRAYLASTDSNDFGVTEEEVDEWLRTFFEAKSEDSVEINRTLLPKKGYDVNGTKTMTGSGEFVFTNANGGTAFRVNEGASFTVEGISVDGEKNIGLGVNVKEKATLVWKDGSILKATEYGILVDGDVTLENVAIEKSSNWLLLNKGASGKLTNVNFYMSGSAGIVVEKGASCQIGGKETILERTGSCAVKNSGELVMTGGTTHMTAGYGIENLGTAEISNVTMNRSVSGGGILNEKGAVVKAENCTFTNNKYHVRNLGEMTLNSNKMEVSSGSSVYSDVGSVLEINDLYIRDSSYNGLYVLNSTVTASNLKCEMINSTAITVMGKDSTVKVDGLDVDNCNVAIRNGEDSDKTYGEVYASNVTVKNADSYNVVSYGGVCDVSDSTLHPSKGYSVYIRNGSSILDSVKILGTSVDGKGGLAVGSSAFHDAKVVIKGDTEITGCMGSGISNDGTLTIYDVDIHDNNVSGKNERGTGIISYGTVYLHDGEIHDNYSVKYGAGIWLGDRAKTGQAGKLYMYGGTVCDNVAGVNGGGITVGAEPCVLEMHGGSVTGNRAYGKGDGILLNGKFALYDADSFEDNDVYLYSSKNKVQVLADSLSFGKMKIVPDGYTYNKVLVEFKNAKAATKLCKHFTTRNHQFTVGANDKNGILVNNIKDFDTTYDFSKASNVTVTTFEQLKKEIEGTKIGTSKVIHIASDIVLKDKITLPVLTDIKLTDDGTSRVLTRGTAGNLFVVTKASHLVMSGTSQLTLDGGATRGVVAEHGLVTVKNFGYFVLEDNAVLQNAYNTGTTSAGGVRGAAVNLDRDGYFLLKGGTMKNCSSPVDDNYNTSYCAVYLATSSGMSIKSGTIADCNDKAIFSYGKVYMSGGSIDGCSHMKSGGASFRGTVLVMTGGTMENCISTNSGSAVFMITSSMMPEGYFLLDGGTICNNVVGTALSSNKVGGAVYIGENCVFDFKSGSVSDNVAGDEHIKMSGGGIYNAGTANIGAGAIISGNEASLHHGGIYNTGTMTITGATITENKSTNTKYNGTGYGVGAAIYNKGTLSVDGARVTNNYLGTTGTIYNSAGKLEIKNMTFTGNVPETGEETKGVDLRVATDTESATLSGTIIAKEWDYAFRLDEDKVFVLAEDFSSAGEINLYLNGTIEHGRQVLKGQVTADTVKVFNWMNAPEGYYLADDGYVTMYPAYILDEDGEKIWCETVTKAIESVEAEETIYLNCDVEENVKVTKEITLSGAYTLVGTLTIADGVTCHLNDVIVDGNAIVGESAVVGVSGDTQITGITSLESNAVVQIDATVTASPVLTMDLPEDAKAGTTVLVDDAEGALVTEHYLAFDVIYAEETENILIIESDGKLEELADVVTNTRTEKTYDTLADAVAEAKAEDTLVLSNKIPVNNLVIDKNLTISGGYFVSGSLFVTDGVTLTLADKVSVRTIVLEGTKAKVNLSGDWERENIADIVVNSPDDYASKGTVIITGDVADNYAGCTVSDAKEYMLYINGDGNAILTNRAEAEIAETGVRYKTLEEAVSMATAGQTIRLLSNVQLESELVISLPITITTDGVTDRVITSTYKSGYVIKIEAETAKLSGTDDNSRLIIDGQDVERSDSLVYSEEGTAVTLQYVTITGGNSSSDGGAFASEGSFVIENSSFINNQADGSGGAIWASGKNLFTITDCEFTNNQADKQGGAIYSNGSKSAAIQLTDCTFEQNTAGSSGGAVHVGNKNTLNVKDSSFNNNTATANYGGAVAMGTGTSEVVLEGKVIFANNTAGQSNYGGGAVMTGSGFTIKTGADVTFEQNKAVTTLGGAIYFNATNTPTFTLEEGASLVMTDNVDKNGMTDIAVKREMAAQINLNGSYNISKIYAEAGTLITVGTKAKDLNSETLTMVYLTGTVLDGMQLVTGSTTADTIFAVSASQSVTLNADGYLGVGKVAKLLHEGSSSYYGSLAEAVTAAEDGDIITLIANIELGTPLTITKGVTITTDNTSRTISFPSNISDFPITVDANGKTVVFKGSSKDEKLIFEGTGDTSCSYSILYLKEATKVTMEYVNIENAHRSGSGGGGAINCAVPLTLTNCAFTNCKAANGKNAGAIVMSGQKLIAEYCTFSGCQATNGGAIYSSGEMVMTGCTFTGNNASTGSGGAICGTGEGKATTTLTGCTFTGNTALGSAGGAVHVGSKNIMTINSCTFEKNHAKTYGGAVSMGTGSSTLTLEKECLFEGNTVTGNGTHFGGAVFAPSNLNIKNGAVVKMTGNECTGYDYGDALSINSTSNTGFIIESGAALYVWDNPDTTDSHNDVCLKTGTATNPIIRDGGVYSTSAPETQSSGQNLYAAMRSAVLNFRSVFTSFGK